MQYIMIRNQDFLLFLLIIMGDLPTKYIGVRTTARQLLSL